MYKFEFTVYTPVYNSARYIERVFNSLKNQTYQNFEWIIINDGSTDNSSEIIKSFICICDFRINFIELENNIGFAPSMNLAVEKAQGEFFLIAHADDEFVPDSLIIFHETWGSLSDTQKQNLQGIKCNTIDQYGNLIGSKFPKSPWISDLFDLEFEKKIKGEKWGTIKTDIMREFSFPENEKFVPESLIWFRIYNKYKAVFINDTLRIYYIDHNPNGLMTRFRNDNKFAFGKRYLQLDFINLYLNRLLSHPIIIIKIFIYYWLLSFTCNISVNEGLKDIHGIVRKLFALIFMPFGYLISRNKKQK